MARRFPLTLSKQRKGKSSRKSFNTLQLDLKAKLTSQQTACIQPTVPGAPHFQQGCQSWQIRSFKSRLQIALGAHTSPDEEVLRTALTEIERGKNPQFRTSLLHHWLPLSVSIWGLCASGDTVEIKGYRVKGDTSLTGHFGSSLSDTNNISRLPEERWRGEAFITVDHTVATALTVANRKSSNTQGKALQSSNHQSY